MMIPVMVEVVAPMLWSMEMACRACGLAFDTVGLKDKDHKASIESYPEEWKVASEYLSTWIGDLRRLYRHRVQIRMIDAMSPLGLWKQIRYRLRRFPAFIIDHEKTYVGWDYKELEAVIDQQMHKSTRPPSSP